MKMTKLTALISAGLLGLGHAEPEKKKPTEAEKAQALQTHRKGSEKTAIDQDIQTANAQELRAEQTNMKVIALLMEVEMLMAETTDRLEDGNTDGDTIAIQTEIIEKIYEAAKAKSQ